MASSTWRDFATFTTLNLENDISIAVFAILDRFGPVLCSKSFSSETTTSGIKKFNLPKYASILSIWPMGVVAKTIKKLVSQITSIIHHLHNNKATFWLFIYRLYLFV